VPKFSVVIPTRARFDTLAHALRTAVEQTYSDVEILVHESGDDSRISETVAAVGDARTRLVKTGQPVSMPENWERALNCVTGDYVTFIGDDDGLISSACASVSCILEKMPAEIVSWHPAAYYWPRYIVDHQRNRLQTFLSELGAVEIKRSRVMLELLYNFRTDYSRLPMVYNSFISLALIDRVRSKLGRYFIGASPDVSSGIVNALCSESFLHSHRPLSVSGLSHHSTGHRFYFSGKASLRKEAGADALLPLTIHPTLVDSKNFELAIGNEMLMVKEEAFPNEGPSFSHKNLLYSALQSLDRTPWPDAALADIQEIAQRNSIVINETVVPALAQQRPASAQGARPLDTDSLIVDIDCSRLDISDVRDAARLLEALLPPFQDPTFVIDKQPLRYLPATCPEPVQVSFGRHGNGALFLNFGWGELEAWGVWTIAHRSEIVLPLDSPLQHPMEITISGQMFVHSRHPSAHGFLLLNGRRSAELLAGVENPNVSVQLSVAPDAVGLDRIVLEFEIESPIRPIDHEISSDTRRLGFGLKEIVMAPSGI